MRFISLNNCQLAGVIIKMHTIALLQILFLSLIGGKKHSYVIWNHVLIFTNMQFRFFLDFFLNHLYKFWVLFNG